ncbi:MAG: TIGR01777 family oxidoreductase [Candidatus Baltobacteraceae bacterium]
MGQTIAVTGATGFIGRALIGKLSARGYSVLALTRDTSADGFSAGVEVRQFDPGQNAPNPAAFAGADAVIHLAGESVDGRWTAQKKQRIYDSRICGTRAVVASLAVCPKKPKVLVCASAVGFYGSRGDEILTESSHGGGDFLARVVADWERECRTAREFDIRTVNLRTGIVLGRGGALAKMSAPFRFGLGGPFGSGKQFVPWIHLDDVVALYIFAIEHPEIDGPVNAVAPDYATSARFALALGGALARPAYIPAPGFALRTALGEFAETILASQLVLPAAAEDAGFRWMHPNLEAAMIEAVSPDASRTSLVRHFEAAQLVPASLDSVFAFFSEAQNLESITPPRLGFAFRNLPSAMKRGATTAYTLRIRGVPVAWKTLISQWQPPYRFVDVQLRGPYALWRHAHTFTPEAGGVLVKDSVDYLLPFAPLSNVAAPLVDADVRAIFDFRRSAIAERFA